MPVKIKGKKNKLLTLSVKPVRSSYNKTWNNDQSLIHNFIGKYIANKYKKDLFYLSYTNLVLTYKYTNPVIDYILYFSVKIDDKKLKIKTDFLNDKTDLGFIRKFRNSKKRFHLFSGLQEIPSGTSNNPKTEYHSIAILFDTKENTVDIFNTNETSYIVLDFYTKQFKRFFKKVYDKDVKIDYNLQCVRLETIFEHVDCINYNLKKNENFLPLEGPCIIYAYWLLDLRLKYQSKTKKQVIDFILNKLTKDPLLLCELLLGYAQFITDTVRKVKTKK